MKTDAQVQKDVIAELAWEPSVDAALLGVEVNNGIVTLAGHVTSFAEKWNAEKAAQRVSGVKALVVEVDVRLPGTSHRNDADIATAAHSALQWVSYIPKDSIKVAVDSGWITLTGVLGWEFQRQAAVGAVRHLIGVLGVSDLIALKPPVSSDAIKQDIEAALKRRAKTHAESITVEVEGDQVTLSGAVHSWPDRELARHSAWGTLGVRCVIDNMTIVN